MSRDPYSDALGSEDDETPIFYPGTIDDDCDEEDLDYTDEGRDDT